MPPQRKRKAAELEAAAAIESVTGAPTPPPAVSGLRRSTRKIPAKQIPVITAPAPKRRAVKARAIADTTPIASVPTSIEDVAVTANDEPGSSVVPSKEKVKGRAKGKGKDKGKGKAKAKETDEDQDDTEAGAVDDNYRAARWRPHPPVAVVERIYRCKSQRMFIIGREPVEGANPPEEKFKMAGTTGNVYTIHIKNRPNCTCPDGKKSGTCKHILYVMIKALRAREDLVYQIALTNAELREIFANAPAPGATAPPKSTQKPLDEDDCPICYSEFDAKQSIVFCRAMCGTNMHKECFMQWAATKGPDGVTCVMCRTKWEYEEAVPGLDTAVDVDGASKGAEGYLNVGSQLGLNQTRSYYSNSWRYRSYHKWR